MFAVSLLDSFALRSLIWAITYISPLIFFNFFIIALRQNARLVGRILFASLLIWLIVAFIQTFLDQNFMKFLVGSERAEASMTHRDSGRGVISLAPEPTHFGLQVLLLMGLLSALKLGNFGTLLSGFSAIALSLSTTAFATLVLGVAFLFYRYLVVSGLIVLGALILPLDYLLESDLRVFSLLMTLLDNPSDIFYIDYSVNMRLGGLYAGVSDSFASLLLPAGLSYSDWTREIGAIYERYPWLVEVSEEGWPSGYVMVLYQAGFLSLPLFALLSSTIYQGRHNLNVIVIASLLVFVWQFPLNSPFFGFILAVLIVKRREGGVSETRSGNSPLEPKKF